ncbi:MAG: hypothetical protein PVF71_14495, partial [Desulfobacterales bacterium]
FLPVDRQLNMRPDHLCFYTCRDDILCYIAFALVFGVLCLVFIVAVANMESRSADQPNTKYQTLNTG